MKAFAIIGIMAIAFTAVSCNNTAPDEESVPADESVDSMPSITPLAYDSSILADQREVSRAAERKSGRAPETTASPAPTPKPTPAPNVNKPSEPTPKKTPDTPSAPSNDPISDVKKIVGDMMLIAKAADTGKLAAYLVDDQAKQLTVLVEAGKTLKSKFEETEKLSNEKLGKGIPNDIAGGIKTAMQTEKTLFVQTLSGRKVADLTFVESDGKITVEVGKKSKRLFMTFSSIDNVWKAEIAATWANSLETGKDLATRYTNLLTDAMEMLKDGSMTKENWNIKYDRLKKKYNVMMAPIRPD